MSNKIFMLLIIIWNGSIQAAPQLYLPILDFIYLMTNNFNETIHDTNIFLPEYDFIIIGAGSAGCVMANRLSEIKDFNVLLLEAGDEENLISDVPLTPAATQLTSMQ